MKNRITLLLLAFLVGCAGSQNQLSKIDTIPDDIETVKVVMPVYSQKVAFNLPSNWVAGSQNQQPGWYLIEFLPKDESIKGWNNLLSVQGFENLAGKISGEAILDKIANGFKSICGEPFVYNKLGASKVDSYDAYSAIIGCAEFNESQPTGAQKGQSEMGYFYAIEGKADIYLINKSIRGNAFDAENPILNENNSDEFLKKILPIEICQLSGAQAECLK